MHDGTEGNCRTALQHNQPILCGYKNATPQIQVARISNMTHGYFERVVFPGECLQFEALPDARLEIHTGTMVSAILTDHIPCAHLQIAQVKSDKRVQ